jgi:hypothetical protein
VSRGFPAKRRIVNEVLSSNRKRKKEEVEPLLINLRKPGDLRDFDDSLSELARAEINDICVALREVSVAFALDSHHR